MKQYYFKTLFRFSSLQGIGRTIFVIGLLFTANLLAAQYYILGRGLDDNEKPYDYATAELRGEDYQEQQQCTDQGVFRFENLKSGSYELVIITAYGIRRKKIELRGSIDITLHIPRNIKMDEISVVASVAGDKAPVTHNNVTAAEIEKKDFAQDIPFLLEGTPSLVTTSDAGQGIGYSGLRIRGTDPTRINVTLNGIPINDSESQNVFWVNMPDLASSTTNIQVQRGLGWSKPGVGDLGGGVHINTLGFNYEPYGTLKLGGGSFNTKRATVGVGSGLINGRFTLDGRISYISSDGFIDRAKSDLYAFYGSAGYHHDQTNITLVYALGDEDTYQAWNGVPEQYINDSNLRTYNSAGAEKPGDPYDNEVDDYRQSHVQLHFDQAITPFTRWTNALHYTKGSGYFEQYKADQNLNDYGIEGSPAPSDLVRQRWLDNDFYGITSTLQIGSPEERYFIIGGAWNKYLGRHFGEVIWTEAGVPLEELPAYYDNDAEKTDGNIYARSNTKITDQFNITVDLQGRWINYDFVGPNENGNPTDQEVSLKFFNPKLGFNYSAGEHGSFYALTGIVNKEPNRDDYTESTPLSQPKAERLWDTELGYRYHKNDLKLELVGYYMDYKNQLALTGQLNDVGAYTRINVDKSHRLGIEALASYKPIANLEISGSATISESKINAFDEYIDDWDAGNQQIVQHENTDLSFSPSLLANLLLDYTLITNENHLLTVDLGGRYIGKQFVDNTSNEASALKAYSLADLGLHWTLFNKIGKDMHLGLFVKNVFDSKYESNGWIYRFQSGSYDPTPDDPYAGSEGNGQYHLKGYYPQAGRYYLLQFSLNF